jgi:hypothetical protein
MIGLLERYLVAMDPYDPEALAACRHPEFFAEWPQTGERIPSHEADVLIHTNFPGYPRHEEGHGVGEGERWAMSPMLTPVQVRGAGDFWIGETRLEYPDQGRWYGVFIEDMKDGLIVKETGYFARVFDPPAWRADLTEPIPKTGPDTEHPFHGLDADPEGQREREAAVRRYFDEPARRPREEQQAAYVQGIRDLFHDDAYSDLVQSGERLRGRDRITELAERYPSFPSLDHVRRIKGIGDLVVAEAKLRYDQGNFWEIMIFGFRGDKVASTTEYYAEESEAPAWRSQWVEPLETP